MAKKPKKHSAYKKSSRQEESPVRAKKYLGQHFLKDETIAEQIADSLSFHGYKNVLEIASNVCSSMFNKIAE